MDQLSRGLMDTVVGMGIVFTLLILIAVIISLLQYLSPEYKAQKTLDSQNSESKGRREEALLQMEEGQAGQVSVDDEEVDDEELIAVIMSAIAASMQTGTDGLVVRSIRRAKSRING